MSLVAEFDVVVVGGGHAGIEATHAAWKLGVKTAMLTMDVNAIGRMSCNPAVGGVAKGQIVRDIDALGGLMGLLTDKAGIQFRMLNMSKGPAVWGPRAQCDMKYYSEVAREVITNLPRRSLGTYAFEWRTLRDACTRDYERHLPCLQDVHRA